MAAYGEIDRMTVIARQQMKKRTPSQCSLNRFTAIAMCCLQAIFASGCASDKPKSPVQQSDAIGDERSGVPTPRGGMRVAGDTRPMAEIVRERLTGTSNGLEVLRWTVLDANERALSIIAEHAEGCPGSAEMSERLRRNGMRFARVPIEHVQGIVEALGGATMTRNEWHGQVYDWRPLREQVIDHRGTAIAIDGRVRRFDRGEFRLLMRGWTLMMEDGPHMHVEVLPQHRIPRTNDLRLMLNEKPEEAGESFASLALDLELQAGFAYVLVSESPNTDWPQFDQPAKVAPTLPLSARIASAAIEPGIEAASPESAAPPAPVLPPRTRVGPDDDVGPEAGAPRTLGEVLLPCLFSPPTREIIVFVPKIPDELFPPVYESDLTARRANESGETNGAGN